MIGLSKCRYVTPLDAGYSTEFGEESLADHLYPTGRLLLLIYYIHALTSIQIMLTQMEGNLSSQYYVVSYRHTLYHIILNVANILF